MGKHILTKGTLPLKKPVRYRNEDYLNYIRAQDCIGCGRKGPSYVHHCRKLDPGRPTQSKVSDFNCVPLCDECHKYEHNYNLLNFTELYPSAFHLLREWVERNEDTERTGESVTQICTGEEKHMDKSG